MSSDSTRTGENQSGSTSQQQKDIQRQTDQQDARSNQASQSQGKEQTPIQAGAREQPAPPYPEQHLDKPGLESDLEPRPQFMAPQYKGSDKLLDMVAIITGADSGIGRAVAVLYAREGADVAVMYLDEHSDAEETKACIEAGFRAFRWHGVDAEEGKGYNTHVAVRKTYESWH